MATIKMELDDIFECKKVEENTCDHSRWAITKERIFQAADGKHYRVFYSVGATEYQDSPDSGDAEMECVEVEHKEVTVNQWVPV